MGKGKPSIITRRMGKGERGKDEVRKVELNRPGVELRELWLEQTESLP